MGIKTVRHRPYSPDLAPRDFSLFPKLTGCRYETIEMKGAVTKVIDTITQENFHGAFEKLLKRYNKCIATRGDNSEEYEVDRPTRSKRQNTENRNTIQINATKEMLTQENH